MINKKGESPKFKVRSWRWLNAYCGEWVESESMTEEQAWSYANFLRGLHEQIRVEEIKK